MTPKCSARHSRACSPERARSWRPTAQPSRSSSAMPSWPCSAFPSRTRTTLNERPGFTLRIGINTGEVVTGDGEGAEFLVTGSPVIVAARLEESAMHGEILVGPVTREITRGRVKYGAVRTLETKGMGPIEVAPAESLAGP